MDRCNCFYLVSIRCALGFFLLLTVRVAEADPCVSLVNSSFEICTNAGYDTTTPFPSYITAAIKSDIAAEVIHAINLTRNCAVKGLAEAIECSSVVPKCNSLGRPILPCREVCAEFLKQCESHMDVFNLDYLISFCLVLPTNSSNCAPCMVPPNFTTNSSVPGPLDRGCQDVIIPVCKNLGLYDHTLSSVPAQKDLYTWMYDKNYTDNNLETEFPDFVQKLLDKYPKCQENIKKLFCGEHLPPCFPGESPRLYSLCEPLCDQIAFDCPEFFSHDLTAEEYCSTMAKGNSAHGFCQSNQWPESLSWFPYAESTRAPKITKRLPQTTPKALDDSAKGIKVWAIVVTVLLVVQIIAFFVLGVLYWRARLLSSPAYARADL